MLLVKGTTPTIQYTFSDIDPVDITDGYLVVKQGRTNVIEIPLSDAVRDTDTISFTLTQEQSLQLTAGLKALILFDWVIGSTRGQAKLLEAYVGIEGMDEVI